MVEEEEVMITCHAVKHGVLGAGVCIAVLKEGEEGGLIIVIIVWIGGSISIAVDS